MRDIINSRPELLSPAGDMASFKMALDFGADAIYIGGGEFGMRATPKNFTMDEIKKACDMAAARDVNVYLTCNTIPINSEVERLPDFLKNAQAAGVNAIIVADIGVLSIAKKIIPDMAIHISTQAGIMNYMTATQMYEMGAERVVLARELSLEDIKVIRDKTPADLEIEAFVHGAMCMSISGRCLLSSYFTNRDANRGACAQPCRWKYHLVEEKRPGQFFPIEEDDKGSYILNAKDMSMIEHIDKLYQAGITSYKIEGRAKSEYYVAVVTGAYRRAIDLFKQNKNNFVCPQDIVDELSRVSHRQYSTGFYFGRPKEGQYLENGGYVREWEITGNVIEADGEFLTLRLRNKFSVGDTLEILQPSRAVKTVEVTSILNDSGESVDNAPHPMEVFKIPFSGDVSKNSILRKQKS